MSGDGISRQGGQYNEERTILFGGKGRHRNTPGPFHLTASLVGDRPVAALRDLRHTPALPLAPTHGAVFRGGSESRLRVGYGVLARGGSGRHVRHHPLSHEPGDTCLPGGCLRGMVAVGPLRTRYDHLGPSSSGGRRARDHHPCHARRDGVGMVPREKMGEADPRLPLADLHRVGDLPTLGINMAGES